MSVRAKYGDNLRVVWKDKPSATHARARPAAQLAREAKATLGPEAFFSAVSLMLENQTALEDKDLRKYAKKLGLDPTLAMDSVSSSLHLVWVELDESLADLLGVQSTPTMFVNGAARRGVEDGLGARVPVRRCREVGRPARREGLPSVNDLRGARGPGAQRHPRLEEELQGALTHLPADRDRLPARARTALLRPHGARVQAGARARDAAAEGQFEPRLRVLSALPPSRERALAAARDRGGRRSTARTAPPTFYKFAELWFAKASEKPADIKVTLREVARDSVDWVAAGTFVASTFDASLTNPTYDYQLRRDLEEAEELGFSEVPSFIVGKYSFTGLPTSAQLQALVRKTATE
jgi:protein-disulfide isomerase